MSKTKKSAADVDKHRYRCEARHVLKLRGESQERALEYLALVEKARGEKAAQQLRDDCTLQWHRGNKGNPGVWR